MRIFKALSKRADHSVDFENLPQHIGIIMDGNGRWAKRRGLPRKSGHAAGAKTFERIVEDAGNIGIKVVTVYAFSINSSLVFILAHWNGVNGFGIKKDVLATICTGAPFLSSLGTTSK